jgi:hypothetical protein
VKLNVGIFLLIIGLCSCTDQQLYDSQRNSNKLECDRLQTVQRDECLKRLGPEYNKYEAERQKLLKK